MSCMRKKGQRRGTLLVQVALRIGKKGKRIFSREKTNKKSALTVEKTKAEKGKERVHR